MHKLNYLIIAACALVGPLAPTSVCRADQFGPAAKLPQVKFTDYKLANGLRVILSVDHAAPVVAVSVTYNVGSRNERAGRTGFAHLFEHMMFQGSANVGKGEHMLLIQDNGGTMNGTTNQDRTNYFETVPANQLEMALFLESDRMSSLDISQANLDNQRAVVQEEKRQSYDNQPYGQMSEAVDALAYSSFAYKHTTIGSMEDLNAASLEDVRAFFKTYYAPNNACMAVVGDFNEAAAIKLIQKYFGPIPRQEPPPPVDVAEQPIGGEKRKEIADRLARLTRMEIAYKTVPGDNPDSFALQLLGSILSSGRTSRLYNAIVEKKLALNANAGGFPGRGRGLFNFSATLPPNGSTAEIEKVWDAEIARIQADGVTEAEIQKAKTQARARALVGGGGRFGGTETVLGRANALTQNAIFYNDPGRINTQLPRLLAVTAEDIKRVANQYLNKDNRVIVIDAPEVDPDGLQFETMPSQQGATEMTNRKMRGFALRSSVFGKRLACLLLPGACCLAFVGGAGAQDTNGVSQSTSGAVIKGKAPVAKKLLRVRFPRPKSFKLKNGVTVYVLEDHRLPAVRFRLLMHAGTIYQPKPGVAEMTAAMLTEGTRSRNFQQLAEATEDIGANLNASAGLDTVVLSASGLSETTDTLIDLMADVLLHPVFPGDRLDRIKFQQTSSSSQRRTNPAALTAELVSKVFYGGTPYAQLSPKAPEIDAVTQGDLEAFHDAYYRPNGALLGVSGDVDSRTLKEKLETAFADWKPAPKSAELLPVDLKPKDATKVYLVDRPGSAQTVLQFGNLGVRYKDPDYIPLVVANRILGGGSSGRLFQKIRERKGYTYGAYSALSASQWPGLWSASASVRTPVTEPAAREFFNEFDRLQNQPVPADELEKAKRSIIGSFAGQLENPEGILDRTLTLVQNGLPMDYWDTYPARIQAVTAEDMQRVARQYLGKGRIQVIAVGERSQIEPGLKQFGPIEIVDAAELGGGGGRRGR